LVVSDFLAADGMIPALTDLLEQRELHLLHLGDAHDLLLPADDTFSLEDIESAAGTVIANRELAQNRARMRFERLQAELVGWSNRHRVRYTACDAGDDWRNVLLHHFLRS
jgi:hypothetical protein